MRTGWGKFQSTLPVWGATIRLDGAPVTIWISIHAPRVGSDQVSWSCCCISCHFNPRSPCGERRGKTIGIRFRLRISIHAPRVGSDAEPGASVKFVRYFNPRSPCGERLFSALIGAVEGFISIHAPRVGSDSEKSPYKGCARVFQSTLPVWGATPRA